jgi:hypothetical protein
MRRSAVSKFKGFCAGSVAGQMVVGGRVPVNSAFLLTWDKAEVQEAYLDAIRDLIAALTQARPESRHQTRDFQRPLAFGGVQGQGQRPCRYRGGSRSTIPGRSAEASVSTAALLSSTQPAAAVSW